MLLSGAEELGLTHAQCLELLEQAEDTLQLLISSLTYLIHAERQRAHPDAGLLAEWTALKQEVLDLEHVLPGSDVKAYQEVISTYGRRNLELHLVAARYIEK